MEQTKLEPCPFCGGKQISYHGGKIKDWEWVKTKELKEANFSWLILVFRCKECNTTVLFYCRTYDEGIKAWNERANK